MDWWTVGGSNPRPPHCERGALPAELTAHIYPYGRRIIANALDAVNETEHILMPFRHF